MGTASPLTEAPVSVRKYGLYIGGEWIDTAEHDEVKLPFDGSVVGVVARATDKDVDAAIASAQEGARAMAALANYERAELLLRIAEELKQDGAELAQLICSETGKPIKEARIEASRSVNTLIAAAHEARQLHGEAVPMDFAAGAKGRIAMTVREPLGVIGAITPFNFPLNLTLHKLAPALGAGNAMVHKPAERTPTERFAAGGTRHSGRRAEGSLQRNHRRWTRSRRSHAPSSGRCHDHVHRKHEGRNGTAGKGRLEAHHAGAGQQFRRHCGAGRRFENRDCAIGAGRIWPQRSDLHLVAAHFRA